MSSSFFSASPLLCIVAAAVTALLVVVLESCLGLGIANGLIFTLVARSYKSQQISIVQPDNSVLTSSLTTPGAPAPLEGNTSDLQNLHLISGFGDSGSASVLVRLSPLPPSSRCHFPPSADLPSRTGPPFCQSPETSCLLHRGCEDVCRRNPLCWASLEGFALNLTASLAGRLLTVRTEGPPRNLWGKADGDVGCLDELVTYCRGAVALALVMTAGRLTRDRCEYSATFDLPLPGLYFVQVRVNEIAGTQLLRPDSPSVPKWCEKNFLEKWPWSSRTTFYELYLGMILPPGVSTVTVRSEPASCEAWAAFRGWLHWKKAEDVARLCGLRYSDLDPRYDYVWWDRKTADYVPFKSNHVAPNLKHRVIALVGDSTTQEFLKHWEQDEFLNVLNQTNVHGLMSRGTFPMSLASCERRKGTKYIRSTEQIAQYIADTKADIVIYGENYLTLARISLAEYKALVTRNVQRMLQVMPKTTIFLKETHSISYGAKICAWAHSEVHWLTRPLFTSSSYFKEANGILQNIVKELNVSRVRLLQTYDLAFSASDTSRDGLHLHRSFYSCPNGIVTEVRELLNNSCTEKQCSQYLDGDHLSKTLAAGNNLHWNHMRNLSPDSAIHTASIVLLNMIARLEA